MNIQCPECVDDLPFGEAFVRSFCWAGSAVVFPCPLCNAPNHFSPGEHSLEVGMLGASPVVDPLPGKRYPIIVQTERRGDKLLISFDGKRIELPSSRSYSETMSQRRHSDRG